MVNEINIARANVSTGLFDPEVLKGDAKTFAIAYETFKSENRYLDFQDMLLYAADMLERRPDIRQGYQERFDFLQIDEFQDISESDFRFLRQLGKNLFAVGDDDQTIYSFRTGAGELMHEFAKEAELYDVTENFRSRPEIVDAARGFIEGARERLPKDLRSTRDPGGAVRYRETTPATIQSALQTELVEGAETAILTRTHKEASAIRNMLEQMPELKERVSTVGTLHGSKGLEFDRVIMILNTIENEWGGLIRSIPSVYAQDPIEAAKELEEERRLFYVGMTRAKEELVFMGRETKFLGELGFGPEPPPEAVTPEQIETVNQETVEASRDYRKTWERRFHEFRARYQKLRTYQDLVDMERHGDIPDGEIIENLSFAQVHREKIEELGRDLGIESASRRDRPTRLRGMDGFLANIHRPGKIQIAGYGGLIGADAARVTHGLGLIPRTVAGLGTAAVTRAFRAADEFLYPHVRRPGQQLDYRELHRPLPPEVLESLPDDIDPSAFRLIEPRLDDAYRTQLYEFAHPTEGFEGDPFERPLFHEAGFQMERLRSREEMEALRDQGLLTERHTYLDTRQAGAGMRITPYDPMASQQLFRPPTPPRSERELSAAAMEYMQNMREFLEEQRTSERRPSWLRRPDRRFGWERQHRRLLRPRIGTGIEQFLQENRGREVVDFEQLHRVLTRLNPENTRLAMGIPFGGQDMAAETIGLHTEVLNLLERTFDPSSPYFGSPTDILAGGRLHQLPDGREASADPDGIPRVDSPRFTLGQRARDLFRRDRFRSPLSRFQPGDPLERAGLMIQTYDELGQKVRPGSGVYLGQGRVATALHTQLPQDGMTPVRATVQSVRGGEEIDVTGFLDFDEKLDLAILNLDQTNEAIKDLEGARLGRGWIGRGRGLRTMGAGQFVEPGSPELGLMSPELAADATRVRLPFSTEGLRGSVGEGLVRLQRTPEQIAKDVDNVFPVQSGSGVFSRGFFGDRLQGIIGGRSADRQGFFYPAQMVRRLLRRRGGVGGYQDVVSQFTPDTEGVITEAVAGRLDPLLEPDAVRAERMGVRQQTRQAYKMLTAREQYLGEYAPEISDLETRIYDIQGAGIPDAAGLEEISQAHTRLSEIRRPLEGQRGLDAQIRNLLGADAPVDLADVDSRIYSRGYQFGQRIQETGFGRGASRVFDVLGRGAGIAGRVGGIAGKTVGKALPILELFDVLDKADYFTGGAERRITGEVLQEGDTSDIIDRYRMLAESRALHTEGGYGVFRNLLSTGPTELDTDYFEREGGLRDIGSMPLVGGALKWAERIPVLDQATVFWDKVEKGAVGRVVHAYADPTGRGARERIDEQMEQIGAALTQAAPTFNRQERSVMQAALQSQEKALEKELALVGDTSGAEQERQRIQSEIERYEGMTDKYVPYKPSQLKHADDFSSWILGSAYVRSGRMKRETALENLRDQLQQLPDTRSADLRERLSSVREQLGALGAGGRRVLPYVGAVAPLTEPLFGEALKEERARRMGFVEEQAIAETEAVTAPARRALEESERKRKPLLRPPSVAPYTAPSAVAPVAVEDMPEPIIPEDTRPRMSVPPLTEALTGAERDAEIARRLGFVEEQAIAETEAVTEPARRAMEADQEWRYRFPELRVPRDGQSYFRGEGQFTYRQPPIHVEGERFRQPDTAPYTAPSAVAPVAVEDTRPRISVPPLTMPEEPVVGVPPIRDTSMGLFRAMEQADLEQQPYITFKDLDKSVIDGDTLKGLLYAPRLGVHGQEESIRYLGFDSAEKDPRGMQRFMYNRKFRTESAITTEERRAARATEMHKEFLEQFRVGDEYRVPLEMDEHLERGKYGRVLANPMGAMDTYFKEAIEKGVARVYGSSAFLGGESTLYERMYTDSEKEKAKRHYARIEDDIFKAEREETYRKITDPAFAIRDRFTGMGETYTQAGLMGTGLDGDFGLIGEAYTGRAQAQTNLEAYQKQIAEGQVKLKVAREKFEHTDPLEPDYRESEEIKNLEAAIKHAERAAEAEQRAIKEYQRVIDQSSKLVENMRKQLTDTKLTMLKEERAAFLQTQKTETTAIQEQIKEQNRFRQGFGKEVLGDVDFMTRFETDHRTGLIGEQGDVTTTLTGVRAELEAQQGLVDTKRTVWQEAFAAFESAPGKETGDALETAEQAYNLERANLQHLQGMEQIYSRKLGILEAGITTSEAAAQASERIAEQLEVQARMYEARTSSEALADTFKGIGEEHADLKETGAFSLRDVLYLDPETRIDSGVKDWVQGSRVGLIGQREGIMPRLLESQDALSADESELKDLKDQLETEKGKEDIDASEVARLSAEIENKQKVVDNQKKIVEDYTKQVEAINKQLEDIQTQLDAHESAIGKQLQLQKEREEGFRVEGEKEQIGELLKTPYEQYTPEQQELFQRLMTQEGTDYAPEHVKGFKEAFTAVQEARVTSPHKMGAVYDALSYEQLMAQYDTDTGEFKGLPKQQQQMAKDRLMKVATPEQLLELHDKEQAAYAASPEGMYKQSLKDRQEAEREAKRQQRLAERRREYAERKQLREDTRHIDFVAKPLVQLPGRFIQAFDRRGAIDRSGRQRLSDLRESVGEQKRDVMEDANLTIRQRSQQLERIEKESAKRRIQIEKDIAEAKKKAFSDVLDSFKNMFRDMLIRETEYMAQSQIREWWLGRQGWEQDGYGGYQRQTPGGGGSLPIAVNIPFGDQSVRSDTGGTFVGSPAGLRGGNVSQPMYYQGGGAAPRLITRPEGDTRFYAPDGRIFSDQESYKRQMELETGEKDRGGIFDIGVNIATLGTHQLGEEHLWSRWDDPETGDRPWWATAGQWGQDYAVGEYISKPVLGFAWDAVKSGGSSALDALGFGGQAADVANVVDTTSGLGEVFGPTLDTVSSGFSQVSDFGPLKESMSGLSAIPEIPPELQQVADVNFEPVTRGISEATKQGIEEGMSQVDGDPLMKVVEDSGKEGAQGFWQGLMDNPAVEVGGDALAYHSVMSQITKPLQDFDSIEAQQGKETNPYNILIDEIFGETWGEFGGNLWQGAKNVGGFAKELGGGAVDFLGDIGGFVADIPGTLNRTSGTGNWFTQTGKDIGGFFGDTFGKDSWRSVTDLFAGMGDWFSFDHPVNDEM